MKKNGHLFKPGESGNPDGRPKGSKDKRTELRNLLEPHAEDLINKAVELAKGGDTTALKMCLDRLVSPIRAKDEKIIIEGLGGKLSEQGQTVIETMGRGDIAPSDATAVLQALAAQARIIEMDDLEKRIERLERKHGT